MSQQTVKEIEKLEISPPLRLVGMSWILILIIFLLSSTVWDIVIKIILGVFLFGVIRGSFYPIWDRYETMGAFVTMQAMWFAGLLWVPESFFFLRYLFIFLIVLGIATKFKQIKHINEGKGPDLRHDL